MNSNTARNCKKKSNDVYYTPLALAKTAIDMIPEEYNNKLWLDPCRGQGAYYDQFPTDSKLYCEISEDIDFFKFKLKVDVICSNPPYSIIDKWLSQSISLKPKVINFLIGINNLTPKRMEYMNNNGYGLTKLHICKVFKWFGMSIIVQFEKDKSNVISFDRTVWK